MLPYSAACWRPERSAWLCMSPCEIGLYSSRRLTGLAYEFSEDSRRVPEPFLLIACTSRIVTISGSGGFSGFPAYSQIF